MLSEKDLILIFSLNGCRFAIEITYLVEIVEGLMVSSPSKIGNTLGDVAFRGKSVPLVDLKKRMKLEAVKKTCSTIVVVKVDGRIIAFPADSVEGVIKIKDNILPFPDVMLEDKGVFSFVCHWEGRYVIGVNPIVLFDANFFQNLQ